MNLSNLTAAQLRKAAVLKEKITALQNDLARLLGDSGVAAKPAKRTMSAAARAKIAAAQKARWARVKAAKKK